MSCDASHCENLELLVSYSTYSAYDRVETELSAAPLRRIRVIIVSSNVTAWIRYKYRYRAARIFYKMK